MTNWLLGARLRSVSPAWHGKRRGVFLCAAIVAVGSFAGFISRRPYRAANFRSSAISIRVNPLAVRLTGDGLEARQTAVRNFADMNWSFEPNLGQSAPSVKFLARAHDATVFLTDHGICILWPRSTERAAVARTRRSDVLQLQFVNANPAPVVSGEMLLPGKTNYLIGRNPRNWHTSVPHFGAVRYDELYPGVDARFYGGSQNLEYDLVAAPGANLNQIRLRVKGANMIRMDAHGNLLVSVGSRELTMKIPQVYQILNGARVRVAGGYRLLAADEVGFVIGKHRRDLPLVIDPTFSIAYTTFLGGSGAEKGNSVAVDSAGNIYVGGTTTNVSTFPEATTCNDVKSTTCGGASAGGTSTLFVAKVNMSATPPALAYLTFIGGSGDDQGGIIALDNSASSPNLAILGWTTSTDFPITRGTVPPGAVNLTVSKLNAAGNAFIYSEYYGGSGSEATQGTGSIVINSTGGGIATDAAGDVFVTSDTNSANLPASPTAFVSTFTGPSDGMLAEFAAGTGTLTYSTYLGLNAATIGGTGVAVDTKGNVYLGGFTSKTTTTFPAGFQTSYPGGTVDSYLMEINPAVAGSTGLIYGAFIGGSQSDKVMSLALDTAAPPNVYVTGVTQSANLIPSAGVANAPFQSAIGTGATQNGFFAVISQSAATPVTPVLQYITYLGGSASDAAQGVAVVSPAQVYVAGSATSTNFPSLCTLQAFSGSQDAFLAEFNPSVGGSASLLNATFFGGTATAEANATVADKSGNAILFGDTLSHDYPLAGNPQNGFQTICSSCQSSPTPESDAFLTKVTLAGSASGCAVFFPAVGTFGSFADGKPAPPLNFQLTNVGTAALTVSAVGVTGANSADFALSNDSCITLSPIAPTKTCAFTATFTPSVIGAETAQVQITDDGVGSPQILNLSGTGTGIGVSLSPGNSLSFPSTPEGSISGEEMITLTNASSDNLLIQQSPPIQGTNAADFKFGSSNTCVASSSSPIVPGGTCTIAVQFAPNEANPPAGGLTLTAQDVLTLQDAVSNSTQAVTISLSGTEIPPTPLIVLSPTSLAFSSQNVGSPTASQRLTVTNTGSSPLMISGISITGADAGDFSQKNTCPISPATVAPNRGSCTISVTFQPTATGPRTAAVSISDNVASSPQMVAISGTGTAAGVSLTPASLTFAGQDPGAPPSAAQPVTLQNTGNGPLAISSISITGANPADFTETDNCPKGPNATLSPNTTCAINVRFAPTAAGSRAASLSVADNALPSPQVVSLAGVGTAPNAQLSVSSVAFGSEIVGTQSSASAVQVSNTGNGPLVISGISFAGANPGDFQALGSCVGANGANVSVAAGSNCTVSVIFAPMAAGPRSAMLNVNDNAGSSPQQAAALGTATDFQLSFGSGASTSMTVVAGGTANFNLQAAPVNGFSGVLAMSCADPIPASTCTISPQQVSVSGGQPVPFTATITTTARSASFLAPPSVLPGTRNILLVGFSLLALALLCFLKRQPQRRFRLAFLLAGALLLCSCGGGPGNSSVNGTPAGTYTVTVSGAIAGTSRNVTLSVTVQ